MKVYTKKIRTVKGLTAGRSLTSETTPPISHLTAAFITLLVKIPILDKNKVHLAQSSVEMAKSTYKPLRITLLDTS